MLDGIVSGAGMLGPDILGEFELFELVELAAENLGKIRFGVRVVEY